MKIKKVLYMLTTFGILFLICTNTYAVRAPFAKEYREMEVCLEIMTIIIPIITILIILRYGLREKFEFFLKIIKVLIKILIVILIIVSIILFKNYAIINFLI